jgi:acyl-CoA reductase-like NAD-dependent aldehyde dehydrogenase
MNTTHARITQVKTHRGLFVDGEYCDSANGGLHVTQCPADGTLVATVIESRASDTSHAIANARADFDAGPWNNSLQSSRKNTPVLLAGNCLPLKPSELTRATALLRRATLAEVTLPAESPLSSPALQLGGKTPNVACAEADIETGGAVSTNDFHPNICRAESAGFGRATNGLELAPVALAEHRKTKHIWQTIAPKPTHSFSA